MKFTDIIRITRSPCKKCVAIIYEVPCEVDSKLAKLLVGFGSPIYDIKKVSLLKIETEDEHIIEAKLGKTYIKFAVPRDLEHTDWNETTRKLEFESVVKNWIEGLLGILIEM